MYATHRALLLLLLTGCIAEDRGTHGDAVPIVIAHRGASGERPEHTLEAYRLAIEQGADFIEPDLVATRDGHLVARHENELGDSTDVSRHPEFAARRTTKHIDGVETTGWFSEDFTLTELKTLRAVERIPEVRPDSARYDGRFEIPTLPEILTLLQLAEREGSRRVGIYPETKHPSWFASEGTHLDGTPIHLSLGQRLIETLVAHDFADPERVWIQSFEVANLIELRRDLMPAAGVELPLMQLLGDMTGVEGPYSQPFDFRLHVERGADLRAVYGALVDCVHGGITATTGYAELVTGSALACIAAQYAGGIAPWKNALLPAIDGPPAAFLAHALAAGLRVHPYTLRDEARFLRSASDGSPVSMRREIERLLGLGVHGFFTDHPGQGVAARDAFLGRNP